MKVVLDSNVLFVSISRRSAHYPIFQAFEEKRFDLMVTTDILLEYEEVIGDEMGDKIIKDLMKGLKDAPNIGYIHKYFFWNLISADPDDNKYVDCAVASGADFIVTDDSHFKVLKNLSFPKIKIISADDFVEMLTGTKPQKRRH